MIAQFVHVRRAGWERLEALLGRARGRGSGLSAEELDELGRLYRRSTSDLAVARRDFPNDREARYLEQLVGRSHQAFYRRETAETSDIRQFFTAGFPQAFRTALPYTLTAFALFIVPFLLAFVAVKLNPLNGRILLNSSEFVDQVERGKSWLDIPGNERPFAASFIMTNNIRVAFLAFAGGVSFGLGTAYVLVMNGLQLGAVTSLASIYGLGGALSGFVSAHSGIELTVIFIAGGAGLRMGHALLSPGLQSRRVALTEATRQAIQLLFGCVPLLVCAGLLEGFVSPSDLPANLKLAVGVTITAALYGYLILAGRRIAKTLPA